MSSTTFEPSLRVISCDACGAPIEATLHGGTVTCGYCRATNHVRGRDDARDRGAGASGLGEAQRLAELRNQAESQELIPASLGALVTAGMLAHGVQDEARTERLAALRELRRGGAFSEAERLYHLTLLLAPTLEPRARRALLEDALEHLPDVGHRHVLRCTLAQEAALVRDTRAAREWLSGVTPQPSLLEADSRFRIASAMLGVLEGDHGAVTRALGSRIGDVPLASGSLDEAALLLAHVKWATGDRAAMDTLLRAHLATDARRLFGLRCAATRLGPLAPCGAELGVFLVAVEARVRDVLRASTSENALLVFGVALLALSGLVGTAAFTSSGEQGSSSGPLWLFAVQCMFAAGVVLRNSFALRALREVPLEYVRVIRADTEKSHFRLHAVLEHGLGTPVLEQNVSLASRTTFPLGVYPCLALPERNIMKTLAEPELCAAAFASGSSS